MGKLYRMVLVIVLVSFSIPLTAQTAQEIEKLLNEPQVTWAVAARLILEASDVAVFRNPQDAFNYAAQQKWLPKKATPDAPARINGLSKLVLRAFEIKGSLMYSITKSRHFAFRELKYQGVIPGNADPFSYVSGDDLLYIAGKILHIKEKEAETVKKERTSSGSAWAKFIFAVDNAGVESSDPQFILVFHATGEQELGPGSLQFTVQLPFRIHGTGNDLVNLAELPLYDLGGDDYFMSAGYNLALGPGILNLAMEFWPKAHSDPAKLDNWLTFRFKAGYTNLDFGPVAIGFGTYYDYISNGYNYLNRIVPLGRFLDGERIMDNWAFWFRIDLAFGLGLYYELGINTAKREANTVALIDLYYNHKNIFKGGIEVNGKKKFDPFSLKPYVSFVINENMAVGSYFLMEINVAERKATRYTPGFWFKYTM